MIENGNPRILIAAYDYPPIVSAGMYRIASLSKYLSEAGWDVTVLTVKNSFVQQAQWTLRLIPKDVRVIRTRTFEYYQARRSMSVRFSGGKNAPITGTGGAEPEASEANPRTISRKLVSAPFSALGRLLTFPDPKAGWFWPLYKRAADLLASETFDVVLSSSPPHSIHLPFLFLKQRFEFQWVADFRDPWTTPQRVKSNPLASRIHRTMERRVLSSSDRIVANTPGNKAAIEFDFPGIDPGKIKVITNGFDPARVVRKPKQERSDDNFELVFVGAVYPGMLDLYVEAIKYIRDVLGKEPPRLRIVGTLTPELRQRLIAKNGLDEYIVYGGRVTFDDGYDLMSTANALLLLLPHGSGYKTWVPSKLYTYISTSTPICALVPGGDASEILENTGGGVVISATDPAVVGDQILGFLGSVRNGTFDAARNPETLRQYTWEVLSERFHTLLCGVKGT